VQQVIALKQDPSKIFKHPLRNLSAAKAALHALPFKSSLFKNNLNTIFNRNQHRSLRKKVQKVQDLLLLILHLIQI
jgi:hypothetical protein